MASLSLASNDSSCRPIHRRPSLLSQRSLSIHPIGKSEPKPVMNLELNTSSDSLKSISCRSTLLIPGHSRLAKEVNLSPNTQCLLKGMCVKGGGREGRGKEVLCADSRFPPPPLSTSLLYHSRTPLILPPLLFFLS